MSESRLSSSPVISDDDDRRALRDSVSRLVGKYGRSYFQDVCRRGGFPDELWRDLGEAGFLGVHLPEEYGGGGGGLADLAVVIEECAAHGCPMQYIVISSICRRRSSPHHGSHELKERWLPGLADGTKKMAFAITEPDAGTNTHKISTTAHPGRGRRLPHLRGRSTGRRASTRPTRCWWCAATPRSGRAASPRCRCSSCDTRRARASRCRPIDSALGAPERQFIVFFDDVPVEPGNMIGAQGPGLKQVFAGLNPERVARPRIANGIALFALGKAATATPPSAIVWDAPIGAHQGVAHPLAEGLHRGAARPADERPGRRAVRRREGRRRGRQHRQVRGRRGLPGALDQAIQTHGGNGLSNEYGLSDLWFIARMLKTAPVSREMVLNYVAQHSLGLPKSY